MNNKDIYQEIEDEVIYEKHQKLNQLLYKLSHDIGISFNKFKEEYNKYGCDVITDEDVWIIQFESWCHYLDYIKEEYQTVEEYCKEFEL